MPSSSTEAEKSIARTLFDILVRSDGANAFDYLPINTLESAGDGIESPPKYAAKHVLGLRTLCDAMPGGVFQLINTFLKKEHRWKDVAQASRDINRSGHSRANKGSGVLYLTTADGKNQSWTHAKIPGLSPPIIGVRLLTMGGRDGAKIEASITANLPNGVLAKKFYIGTSSSTVDMARVKEVIDLVTLSPAPTLAPKAAPKLSGSGKRSGDSPTGCASPKRRKEDGRDGSAMVGSPDFRAQAKAGKAMRGLAKKKGSEQNLLIVGQISKTIMNSCTKSDLAQPENQAARGLIGAYFFANALNRETSSEASSSVGDPSPVPFSSVPNGTGVPILSSSPVPP